MGVRRFEDLVAWQLAKQLEREVVAFTALRPAAGDGDYCRQIRRSSSSACRNIAEGFGRYRPAEFARFVRIARGSLTETQDHLSEALDKAYLASHAFDALNQLADRAIGASTNLLKYLDACPKEGPRPRRRGP